MSTQIILSLAGSLSTRQEPSAKPPVSAIRKADRKLSCQLLPALEGLLHVLTHELGQVRVSDMGISSRVGRELGSLRQLCGAELSTHA